MIMEIVALMLMNFGNAHKRIGEIARIKLA
jgi:hypothetical protein